MRLEVPFCTWRVFEGITSGLVAPGNAAARTRQTVAAGDEQVFVGLVEQGRGAWRRGTEPMSSSEALTAGADVALYAAKAAGRDCVIVDGA